jgi:hypothetical protein
MLWHTNLEGLSDDYRNNKAELSLSDAKVARESEEDG